MTQAIEPIELTDAELDLVGAGQGNQDGLVNLQNVAVLKPAETEVPPATKPEPVEVEVIATNWGKARFQPAEEITGEKPARQWGE